MVIIQLNENRKTATDDAHKDVAGKFELGVRNERGECSLQLWLAIN